MILLGGHSILALERFMDETRHMIYLCHVAGIPVGEKGAKPAAAVSSPSVGYAKAQASEKCGENQKIRKYCPPSLRGHILPDRKKAARH